MKITFNSTCDTTPKWSDLNVSQLFLDQDGDLMMVVFLEGGEKGLLLWDDEPCIGNNDGEEATTVMRLVTWAEVDFSD